MLKTGSLFLAAAAIAGGASWKEDLLEAERLRAAGQSAQAQMRYAEAEVRLTESLREVEQLTSPNSLDTARVLTNLAALHWSSGNLTQGESHSLRAESIYRQQEADKAERGVNRQILASVYLGQRRFADADKLLRNMLQDGDDRFAATTYANLTVAAIGMDDFVQAEEYARRSVELAKRTLPAGHPAMAACLNNLAQSLRFQAKYAEAESFYREAISIWEASLGPQHPDVGRGFMNLAAFYHERGREAGAEDLYSRAARIFEQALGKQDPQTLIARNELADVLRAERRYTESEKLARLTMAEMEKAFRADDPRLVRALLNYARLLDETRRRAQALAVLKKIPGMDASFR